MKHPVAVASLIAALLTGTTTVNAAEHSLSLGYTQAKMDSVKFHGAEIKYRFEWGSPWSVISAFSYQTEKRGFMDANQREIFDGSTRIKTGSLMAGPAWRFNEFFSLYAMAGLNKVKMHQQWKLKQPGNSVTQATEQYSDTFHHLTPVVSVGTQINPLSSVVVDLSYAVSRPKIHNGHTDLSVISLGIGVKF